MTRWLFLFLIIVMTAIACQSAVKLRSGGSRFRSVGFELLAWNQDTALPCQFGLLTGNRFIYTISRHEGIERKLCYYEFSGKVINTADTIYLVYKKGKRPPDMSNFLVKEISRNYLIQNFANISERFFLRIHNPHFR